MEDIPYPELRLDAIEAARAIADEVEVWASDEHRVGLKPILKRVYAPRERQPVVKVNQRFEWVYVVALVHPESGRSIWYSGFRFGSETIALHAPNR